MAHSRQDVHRSNGDRVEQRGAAARRQELQQQREREFEELDASDRPDEFGRLFPANLRIR